LDDKFLNLIPSTSNLKQTQSKYKSPNSSSTESLSNLSQTKPYGLTKSNGQIKSNGQTMSNEETTSNGQTKSNGVSNSESLSSKIASNLPEMSTSNSNDNTITLKTLGITLKVDAQNKSKNALQPNSSQHNGLSINLTANNPSTSASNTVEDTSASNTVEDDLSQLFNMNNFPISTVEESSINTTTGNGLLNASANAMIEVGNENALTVEEYSKMLFGQSDIDINLDDLLSNSNTMGMNTQGNDAMDIDELLGTFNSLESSTLNKTSGNDMNLDFDSFMANLDASFAEAGIPNGISGNNLNVDLNSILENTNGNNSLDMINSNNNIYVEMINENSNGMGNNHNTLDLTLGSVNGQNGYSHENVEDGVKDLVEDEGKDVVGKIINGALKEGKKVVNKNDYEMVS
jgi:hypothetical protein